MGMPFDTFQIEQIPFLGLSFSAHSKLNTFQIEHIQN